MNNFIKTTSQHNTARLIIFYLLLNSLFSRGQANHNDNSDTEISNKFSNSLYAQTIFENINLYDSNLILINRSEIYSKFYYIDTTSVCFIPDSKFINNNFIGVEQFSLIKHDRIFDTITNNSNPDFLMFLYVIRTATGEYTGKTKFAFQVRKKEVSSLNSIALTFTEKFDLIGSWEVAHILVNKEKYKLDPCLKSFTLLINKDQTFNQQYSNGVKCNSKLNSKTIKHLGLTQDSISYEITLKHGYWKAEQDSFYFINQDGQNLLIYKYKLKNENLLVLQYDNYMEIWLRRQIE